MYRLLLFLQVVGIGLRSVFELIRESCTTHPALCTRALQALLDMLQGQMPEGLAKEPDDIIGKLMDYCNSHMPLTSIPFTLMDSTVTPLLWGFFFFVKELTLLGTANFQG